MKKKTFDLITKKGNFVAWEGDNDGETAIAYMSDDAEFIFAINCMRDNSVKEGGKDEDGVYPYHWAADSVYPENEPRFASNEEVALYLKKMKEYGEDFISYEEADEKEDVKENNEEMKGDVNIKSCILGKGTVVFGGGIQLFVEYDPESKTASVKFAELKQPLKPGENIPFGAKTYDPQVCFVFDEIKSIDIVREALDIAEYTLKHGELKPFKAAKITSKPNNDLSATIGMMKSEDYKERFKAEYYQTKIRYDKLVKMVKNWEKGNLCFTPTCPRVTYDFQLDAMAKYLGILEMRAKMEGIEL